MNDFESDLDFLKVGFTEILKKPIKINKIQKVLNLMLNSWEKIIFFVIFVSLLNFIFLYFYLGKSTSKKI